MEETTSSADPTRNDSAPLKGDTDPNSCGEAFKHDANGQQKVNKDNNVGKEQPKQHLRRRQKGDSHPDILQVEDVPTRAWFILGASFPVFLVVVWYFWCPYVFTPVAVYIKKLYFFGVGKSHVTITVIVTTMIDDNVHGSDHSSEQRLFLGKGHSKGASVNPFILGVHLI